MVKTMVRKAVPLRPMEVHNGTDIHLWPLANLMLEQIIIHLVDKRKAVGVGFLHGGKVFDTNRIQLWVHSALSEELAELQSSQVCREWGFIRLVTEDQQHSLGFSSRASPAQTISSLDAGVECTISKFSDDPNMRDIVDSLGKEGLQRALHRLEHREMINGMKFNKCKCQILHLGWSNAGHLWENKFHMKNVKDTTTTGSGCTKTKKD
ncbi:hypothetical protein WISP_26390 [Willisornis vidua]|uniref:Uncharacterized protein n=1 Tax=Willisornis vidua TaxID=1566151 RepID=A0ABQ9DR12_9PASS|nr:hypothetical protein WISP_26390 [Willisornis vidua]